jgi:uncharacterized protein (DUF2267 family)
MERIQERAAPGTALPVEGAEAQRLYRDVEDQTKLPSHVTGADAIDAVLCVLSQRLSGGEAADMLQALPAPARPRRCPRHHQERPDLFGRLGFIERVAAHLRVSNEEAEAIARAVLAVVPRWLPRKEVQHVSSQLPPDLRQLWLSPLEAPPIMSPLGGASPAPADRLALRVFEEIKGSGLLPPDVTEADALAAVLCPLCQRLSRGEAKDLLLALPPGLRPLLERCALHRAEEGEKFHREELLQRIAQQLNVSAAQAEAIARLVFTALQRALPAKEIRDVASQLPSDLQSLWIDNPVAASRAPAQG